MLKKAKAELGSQHTEKAKGMAQAVLDSSHQIWLAGLGAFAKAQQGEDQRAGEEYDTRGGANDVDRERYCGEGRLDSDEVGSENSADGEQDRQSDAQVIVRL